MPAINVFVFGIMVLQQKKKLENSCEFAHKKLDIAYALYKIQCLYLMFLFSLYFYKNYIFALNRLFF